MSDAAQWELAVDAHDQIGEGPSWDVGDQSLLWVDIAGQRVWRLDPADGQHVATHLRADGGRRPAPCSWRPGALPPGWRLADGLRRGTRATPRGHRGGRSGHPAQRCQGGPGRPPLGRHDGPRRPGGCRHLLPHRRRRLGGSHRPSHHDLERHRLEPRRCAHVLHRQRHAPGGRLRLRPGQRHGPRATAVHPLRGVGRAAGRHDRRCRRLPVGRLLRRLGRAPLHARRIPGPCHPPARRAHHQLRLRWPGPVRPLRHERHGRPRPRSQLAEQPHAGGLFVLRPGVAGLPSTPFAG